MFEKEILNIVYLCEMQTQVASISSIKVGVHHNQPVWEGRLLNIHEIGGNKKKDKLPESLYHSFVSLCHAISTQNHNHKNIFNFTLAKTGAVLLKDLVYFKNSFY